ncbi:dTDP-4-dehydrorhamnose 3,5-epimerase [Biformimicrobium ophioploci]|uniref:dTDP-4-dehydrorhamnose 3,5-epimerase n=1 Tax=Biformimicrobium ophioploci TaxID=3036711 RepID=UPI002557A47D|nr:dTDP-4-dehydrorhamnose 3,5-epimerase [Microbulbifer sp. NKW57]
MNFIETDIPDVKIIEPIAHGDDRGYFMETFRENVFHRACGKTRFVQENQSLSQQGVLRGLHYQLNSPQGKLVRAISGKIFDVAIDLRRSSSSYGSWVGTVLSDENRHQLWIPEGFAHGFFTLSQSALISYKCTNYYHPESDRCIRWDDQTIAISWPIPKKAIPKISEKDENGLSFLHAETFA